MNDTKLNWPKRLTADPPEKGDTVVVIGLHANKYPGEGKVTLVTARNTYVKFPNLADPVGFQPAFLRKKI